MTIDRLMLHFIEIILLEYYYEITFHYHLEVIQGVSRRVYITYIRENIYTILMKIGLGGLQVMTDGRKYFDRHATSSYFLSYLPLKSICNEEIQEGTRNLQESILLL